jgi:phosphoserine phosphatase RsbU/P
MHIKNNSISVEETARELKKITRLNHDLVIRVVTVLNILFSISDYFTAPAFWVTFLLIRIAITLIFFSVYLLQDRLHIHPKWTLYTAYLGCIIENAYMYNVIDLVTLQKFTFAFIATFIGAGMFAVWNYRLSLIAIVFSILLNILLFWKLSPLSTEEYLANGAFLTLMVSIFSIVLVHSRVTNMIKEIQYRLQLAKANEEIANQNKNIVDSIEYAKRIQEAMLPDEATNPWFNQNGFIFFQPKDIVSGDFFWFKKTESRSGTRYKIALGDCTGHGVPGALMSILAISSLDEINSDESEEKPHFILNKLKIKITDSLKQRGEIGEQKDGLDLALIHVKPESKKIEFAGAQLSAILIRNGEISELKGDRMPIGIHWGMQNSFSLYERDGQQGDWIYLFSDGFQDQIGGKEGKKYLSKRFRNLLVSINALSHSQQKEAIKNEFLSWKNENDQTDDVLVMGFRI